MLCKCNVMYHSSIARVCVAGFLITCLLSGTRLTCLLVYFGIGTVCVPVVVPGVEGCAALVPLLLTPMSSPTILRFDVNSLSLNMYNAKPATAAPPQTKRGSPRTARQLWIACYPH